MYKILIVDDDQLLLKAAAKAFKASGQFNVIIANSYYEAQKKTENQEFDIICSEFILNRSTNIDIIRLLKADKRFKKTPFILWTKNPNLLQPMAEQDKVYVVGKDVTFDMLIDVTLNFIHKTATPVPVKPKGPQVDVRILNHFINGSIVSINMMTNAENLQNKPAYLLKNDETLNLAISGKIEIISDAFNGFLKVSFPQKTFLKMIASMLGEEHTTITPEIKDAAGELTNVILGQAKKGLSEEGFSFQKTIPSVVLEDSTSKLPANNATIVVPFECDLGDFYIQITINQ